MIGLENQPPTCYNLTMSVFISLGIVFIAMLILAFLQLTPGVFALFRHYASGKYSQKRSAILTSFYMLGVETVAAGLFIAALLFSNLFFIYSFRPETSFLAWVLVGILVALALMSFVAYFRSGRGTQLFIPRKCADALENYAKEASSRSDAFVLGALTGVLELPFSLPLYLISAISVVELSAELILGQVLGLCFILAPMAPLLAIRYKFHIGYNLADIQKDRVKNKNFVRFVIGFSYIALAILFIYFGIN